MTHRFWFYMLLVPMALALYLGAVATAYADETIPPAWYANGDVETRAYVDYYFSRDVTVRIYGEPAFSFEHPKRPTVMIRLGDTELPMLFDTGTYTCILRLEEEDPLPSGLRPVGDSSVPAWLESKRLVDCNVMLSYAITDSMNLGDVYLRNVPFRIYRDGAGEERDYAGALSPVLFHDYIIEVDNAAQLIRLHEPMDYLPSRNALVLPILMLPRGLFVPLFIEDEQLWFHLDTGFSGGVGLLPDTIARHGDAIIESGGTSRFAGWREQQSYRDLTLAALTIKPYPMLSWAPRESLVLHDVDTVAYRDCYQELTGYNIGGIVGSGFLMRFNYSLDLRLGRLYLMPRAEW